MNKDPLTIATAIHRAADILLQAGIRPGTVAMSRWNFRRLLDELPSEISLAVADRQYYDGVRIEIHDDPSPVCQHCRGTGKAEERLAA